VNLPDLPFIAKLRDHDGVYVFPDKNAPSFRPGHAIAGPFSDVRGARLWILEQLEAQLVDARRAVWVEVCKRLGSMSQDLGLEFYLIDMVLHGKPIEKIARYIPRGRQTDRRLLASGDEAA
jgi:hypothetical protein